jgi:hypothetical protein
VPRPDSGPVEGIDGVEPSDVEIKRDGPSITYDTLAAISAPGRGRTGVDREHEGEGLVGPDRLASRVEYALDPGDVRRRPGGVRVGLQAPRPTR